MNFQDYGNTCCVAAQKVAQLEKYFQELLAVQRDHVERIRQLEENCAWLSSENGKLNVILRANTYSLQDTDLGPARYSSFYQSSDYSIRNPIIWQADKPTAETGWFSHTFSPEINWLATFSDGSLNPSTDINGWITGNNAEHVVCDENCYEQVQTFSPNGNLTDAIIPVIGSEEPGYRELDHPSRLRNLRRNDEEGRLPSQTSAGNHTETSHEDLDFELELPFNRELSLSMMGLRTGFNTSSPKWQLDRYISCFGSNLRQAIPSGNVNKDLLESIATDGVLWVVREAWPEAEAYWKLTASFNGFFQCELWRNFPCRASYAMLHPSYRPTQMQLSVPHCPIIDWLPWPDLRDLVIQYQDEIDVDMVCKTAIQNVIAHRRTGSSGRPKKAYRNRNPPPNIPSFRIWDLCLLEKMSTALPLTADSALTYKPQSASVVALERAYDLIYDDFTTQKLHFSFFEIYPFLYCESAASEFRIQDMPAVPQEDVGSPRQLRVESVQKLVRLIQQKVSKV